MIMNKNLDSLFEFNEEENSLQAETIIKKAKKKSTTRIVAISMAVATTIGALTAVLMAQITPYILDKHVIDASIHHSVYGANTFLGQWEDDRRIVGPTAEVTKYKLIEGIVVPVDTIKEPASNWAWDPSITGAHEDLYRTNGTRVMQFYNPETNFETYKNDLERLNGIPENKVVEIALSFDKVYTIDEVEAMLPKDITLAWSWIDTYASEYVVEAVRYEYDVAGMHYFNQIGEAVEAPWEEFVENLEIAKYNGKESKEDLGYIYELLQNENGTITKEDIPVIGVVVTGTVQELQALQNQDYIKASSIGVIADRY